MTDDINKAWNWKGIQALEVIRTNDFGNIIFSTRSDEYWRICPEELSCQKIAISKEELTRKLKEPDFIEDWTMDWFVAVAKDKLGGLKIGEKYCLKIPGVIGGKYEPDNIGKISFKELILSSGNLALQIEDLDDGAPIKLMT